MYKNYRSPPKSRGYPTFASLPLRQTRPAMQYKSKAARLSAQYNNLPPKSVCRQIVNCASEKKFFNDHLGVSDAINTGAITTISSVPQGDLDSTRDGDQLTIRSIELRWQASSSPGTGTSLQDSVRLILFQWFPATVPTAAQIIFTGLAATLAPYNHDTRFQFKILYDKVVNVTKASATPIQNANSIISLPPVMITNGMKRKIQYTSGSSTVASNMLYVLYCSDVANGAGNNPQVDFITKLNFSDV